ncbi:hypothetical protein [Blastomonas sp.]|uniref:hypothetical protein n=1 Tax=Blastomonas sp. TaxID=1909299 RepID=UPI003592EB44
MAVLTGRLLAGCAAALVIITSAAPAEAQQRRERAGPPPVPSGQSYADSSAILVAELALARLALDKGQWTAFRDTAAPDALMFAPQVAVAGDWLKGRADPPQARKWQPQQLFMACDGRTGASTGASQATDGSVGLYTTVWQNLEKPRAKKPDWKWVLTHSAPVARGRTGDDMISSRTAVCTGDRKAALGDIPMGAYTKKGPAISAAASGARASDDGTLVWRWDSRADGSRTVQIELWNGTGYDVVVRDDVAGGSL